jgi:signal transduction histidine kinase/ligand-binding sensor domain-containing protein
VFFAITKLFRCKLLGSFVLFFICGAAAAATNLVWFSRPWQTDDGLPNNNVLAIAQTMNGFLWLGTPSGLVSFDGAQFQKFNLTNAAFAGNRGVTLMVGSRSGGLWLAMNRGAVAYLDGPRTKVFTVRDGLVDGQVRSLVEAGDGTLWILFNGGGSRLIKNGKVTALPKMDNLPIGQLTALACDANGDIWWVKGGELGIYRDGKFQRLTRIGNWSPGLAAAKDGGVWVCTGAHLFHCDATGRMDDHGNFDSNRTAGNCTALIEDSEGAVWIGTAFGGLIHYDGSTFENISTSRPEIQSLLEDREGNIWAGTLGGGLNRIQRRVVQLQGVESGLPFESLRSLCEDSKGTLWAVTENGMLARHGQHGWQTVSTNANWAPNYLTCVAADPAGGLWIGGRARRLLHWDESQGVVLVQSNSLIGTIFSMQPCTNGDLWLGEIGSVNGLQCLHNGNLITHKLPKDIRTLRAMALDSSGNVWIGSARGDLLRARGDEVVREPLPESDKALSIRCLTTTPDGSLWIGFDGMGVGWMKDGHYHRVSTMEGLFDDYISQIISDDNGWLWFGSDHGIFKAREKDLEAVAEGKIARIQTIHYGRDEGAENLQANFGYSPGGLRSRDGRLWIPTRSGLAVIDPKQQQKNIGPLPVLLQKVIVDDQIIARYESVAELADDGKAVMLEHSSGKLHLPPDYRRLEIDFTALSFIGLENIRFRYRLSGFDKDWQETATPRRAVYSRLPSGDYTFEAQACNSEGIWNETGATLAFTVLPYFWQTWWFRILSGFLLLVTVIASVRYFENKRTQRQLARLEHERAIEQERTRIAKDIHDDLGANLTEITLLSELAQSPDAPADEIRTDIRRIAGKARKLTNSLDEIVWAVNPRNDTLDSFVTYTCLYAEDFLQTAKIRCRLKVPGKIPNRTLATNVRHNLFLVVKEALNNIVKHASANEVNIAVSLVENGFELVIKDNGRGFDSPGADKSTGRNGLLNMRQRTEEIGGKFNQESVSGEGTTITLAVNFLDE